MRRRHYDRWARRHAMLRPPRRETRAIAGAVGEFSATRWTTAAPIPGGLTSADLIGGTLASTIEHDLDDVVFGVDLGRQPEPDTSDLVVQTVPALVQVPDRLLARPAVIDRNGPNVPPAVRDIGVDEQPADFIPCCMGSAHAGPMGCTCWEPVYDLEQQPLDLATEPTTRAKCCHDCAYRNGSPERTDEEERVDLEQMAHDPAKEFWCHQGARRVVAFRHPDGRELPAGEGDYRPPQGPNAAGVECVWLADGTAGERCAGWAAHRRTSSAGVGE